VRALLSVGRGHAAQAGYTLLEVTLAITILAVASALVVVNMPRPAPTLEREARTLAARLQAAGQEAVVGGTPVGVDVDETGYRFRRRLAGAWRPIADDLTLHSQAWSEAVMVKVEREGSALDRSRLAGLEEPAAGSYLDTERSRDTKRRDPAPLLLFDSVGSATELSLDLSDAKGGGGYHITVAADGAISFTTPRKKGR
jgi:type II secretion system protein H